ncbi:hypothetical protein HQ576_16060, partial [bacterium]|nr:hypothetical protein [bacterium]
MWLVCVFGIPYVVYWALSLPLRRQERGRLLLDIVETCVAQGKSVEHALVSLAEAERTSLKSYDRVAAWLLTSLPTFTRPWVWLRRRRRRAVFGPRLYRLADHLQGGMPLPQALRKVPGLVPPQVAEMLQVGGEAGDIRKALPACRRVLTSATPRMRSAMNYVVVLASGFFLTGVGVFLFAVLYIVPKIQEMLRDMAMRESALVSPYAQTLFNVAAALSLLVVSCALFYIGGPRLVAFLRLRRLGDRLAVLLPWRRKQLQRDFSAMLAVLLDAEVPEAKAVALAAAATANHVFVRRAEAAAAAMEHGEPLTDALGRLDRSGELKWRLANAAHGRLGFLDALAGWHESLEAKAFQQEQTAAQAVTTALVLSNGAIVALVAIGFFHIL